MEHKKHGMHHHRKGEMEHHKERHKHKSAHHAKKAAHHSSHAKMHHSSMIDNRHVSDNHQQGIERVKQRPGDMEVGQHGKMGMNHKRADSFKRSSGKMTPARG